MSSPICFRDWLPGQAPGWLQRPNGAAWFWAHGDALDSVEDAARKSVLARFPAYTTEDGLALIGAERGLERVSGESADDYAARVVAAWTSWQLCGTPLGLLSALRVVGIENAQIRPENGRTYTLDEDGELVVSEPFEDEDDNPIPWAMRGEPFWSEFELIIPAEGGPWTDSETGEVIPPVEDSAAVRLLKRIVRKWKGAHCRCAGIVALTEIGMLVDYPERVFSGEDEDAIGMWDSDSDFFDEAFCDVYLVDVGPNKLPVLKTVRKFTGLGLAATKALIETAPCVVASAMSESDALDFIGALAANGATYRLVDSASQGTTAAVKWLIEGQ